MAELLIRTQDKPSSGNVYTDRHRLGRGDVVVVMPDGHKWSDVEKAAPFWRILRLPGVGPNKLTQLLASDVGYGDFEAEKASKVLQRRAYKIDLLALVALLADVVKVGEIATQPTKAEVYALALVQAKPALVDPAIIGAASSATKVFG